MNPEQAAHEFRVHSVGMQGVGWLYHNAEEGYRFFLVPKGEDPPPQMETVRLDPPMEFWVDEPEGPTMPTYNRIVWRPVYPPQTIELP